MNDFGNYLYTLRKAKGYTQAELADKLGVTNKAVSKWETGEAFPETAQLVPLADIFGVTTDELLRGRSAQCAIPPQENETPPADSAEEIARKYQPDWWHKKFAALIVCGFASIAAGCHFRHRGGIAHRNGMGAYCRHVRADGAHRDRRRSVHLRGRRFGICLSARERRRMEIATRRVYPPLAGGNVLCHARRYRHRLLRAVRRGGAVAQPCGIRRRYSLRGLPVIAVGVSFSFTAASCGTATAKKSSAAA